MQDKYARDVKRQKTDPSILTALCDFLAASCPTKSGDRSVTFHQYVSDDALYQAYATTCFPAVSFSTFYNIKQWMRVRHAGKYFGQFDCANCRRLNQLKQKQPLTMEEGQELQRCEHHHQLVFPSAISTSSSGLLSNRVSYCS
jgi:hypothetical protein